MSVTPDQNNRSILLKTSLQEYFNKDKTALMKFVDTVLKKTPYSLRVLEWFCSNYSKKNNISYNIGKNKEFNVFLSYKCELTSFSKKTFDPFKRKHDGYSKFKIYYNDKDFVYTTVGQLNFFKWCIKNKILNYVNNNLKDIKKDMDESTNYKKPNKKNTVEDLTLKKKMIENDRKKRQSLSVSATRTCIKRDKKVVLVFK